MNYMKRKQSYPNGEHTGELEGEFVHGSTETIRVTKEMLEDNVNNPSHYNQGGVECIEGIKAALSEEEFRGYLRGNAMKYVWRCRYKGKTVEDIDKSQWYLNKLKETFDV